MPQVKRTRLFAHDEMEAAKVFDSWFCANHSVLTKLAGRGSSSDTRMQVQYTFETMPTLFVGSSHPLS
jgi:hypothetical protein